MVIEMQLCVFLNPARVFRWHLWLIDELSNVAGNTVDVIRADSGTPWPTSVQLILQLEALLYGARSRGAADIISAIQMPAAAADGTHRGPADIVINLTGQTAGIPTATRVITPLFNGQIDDISIVSALLEHRPVEVSIHDNRSGMPAACAMPSCDDRLIISESLNNILSRTVELLCQSVRRPWDCNAHAVALYDRFSTPIAGHPVRHFAQAVAVKAQRAMTKLATGGDRWAIGWRHAGSTALPQQGLASFAILRDDGRRFYADPFIFDRGGVSYLFCEEFIYATGKGILSVSVRQPDGTWATPVPVIEEDYHLSYPFVFEYEEQIWMVPESGQNRTVDLYVATQFPLKWVKHKTLLSDIAAYDATLYQRDGSWWMFTTTQHLRSSTTDNLELFNAADLGGQWSPLRSNPVLSDTRFSRSAGAIFEQGGKTYRPAQNCSAFYGGAITLCEITSLAPGRYEQRVVGQIHAAGLGVHTYNFSARSGIEVIDAFGNFSRQTHADIYYSSAAAPETAKAETRSAASLCT